VRRGSRAARVSTSDLDDEDTLSATDGGAGSLRDLEPFVGTWKILASLGDEPNADIGAEVSFEWLPGERFLIQRWEVPIPDAPDGIAIIGPDPERAGGYLQHYFDSRGVARVYRMTFEQGVWTLERSEPDLSPLDFSQRFTGRLSADGRTIAGRWEICHDGKTWELDFDLTYAKRLE
jgi:hypothetical protein